MKKNLLLAFLMLLFVVQDSLAQHSFRETTVWYFSNDKTVTQTVLLSPGEKIGNERFIFPSKKIHFEKKSRFQFRTITISDMDKGTYPFLLKSVEAAKCRHGQFTWTGLNQDSGGNAAIKIGSNNSQIQIELDMDLLLDPFFTTTQKAYTNSFELLSEDIYKRLDVIEWKYGWPHGIGQAIAEKIFENIPVLPELALKRYLWNANDQFAFVLLNPKIALQIDNVVKERPDLPYSAKNNPQPENDRFWAFDLVGTTVIQFYRGEDGNLLQTPFLSPAGPLQTNYLGNIKKAKTTPVLQASTIDIQLSSDLKVSHFFSLYQGKLKPNNGQAENGSPDGNIFNSSNSALFFNDHLNADFFKALPRQATATEDSLAFRISVFGQRSVITPMLQIYIQKASVLIKLGSSIGILKQQNIVPDLDEICVHRLFKGSYRKIKHAGDDLRLLPGDRLTY
jgi:hypothetical protein